MGSLYFDHAATTPTRPEVIQAMMPYFTEHAGNPSSIHMFGQRAKRALDEARRTVADVLGAKPAEIYFTSGATESNNIAIQGAAKSYAMFGRHLITSAFEHHAVLHTFQALEKQGFQVTYLPVDEQGLVRPEEVEKALRPDTILVSIMLANNEVGTVQPIQEIAGILRRRGILFHTDAVQAVGKIPVNVRELGVDMLSLTAHKFYGPKGVGALYVREGVEIAPLFFGGHQEGVLRPGTQNVPGIVGLAAALRLACQEMKDEGARMRRLRDLLEQSITERIPDVHVNGHPDKRLAHISNVSFAGLDGEALLLALDMQGIAVSTGSACTAGSTEPSHVLRAMGVDPLWARGSIRFSLGRDTTEEDIRFLIEVLATAVSRLRQMAPAGA
ncbi:MAG: cysteine desulfurase NifS [Anaerolineae bacterium]|nr:cysteine desulfurase NifS [Anaerolineae bacterium]